MGNEAVQLIQIIQQAGVLAVLVVVLLALIREKGVVHKSRFDEMRERALAAEQRERDWVERVLASTNMAKDQTIAASQLVDSLAEALRKKGYAHEEEQ